MADTSFVYGHHQLPGVSVQRVVLSAYDLDAEGSGRIQQDAAGDGYDRDSAVQHDVHAEAIALAAVVDGATHDDDADNDQRDADDERERKAHVPDRLLDPGPCTEEVSSDRPEGYGGDPHDVERT